MLGLALVVGLVAVLLGGALKGLNSYRATVNIFDSKLQELHAVRELKTALVAIIGFNATMTKAEVRHPVADARAHLANCQDKLQDTLKRGRDAGGGNKE